MRSESTSESSSDTEHSGSHESLREAVSASSLEVGCAALERSRVKRLLFRRGSDPFFRSLSLALGPAATLPPLLFPTKGVGVFGADDSAPGCGAGLDLVNLRKACTDPGVDVETASGVSRALSGGTVSSLLIEFCETRLASGPVCEGVSAAGWCRPERLSATRPFGAVATTGVDGLLAAGAGVEDASTAVSIGGSVFAAATSVAGGVVARE